MFHFWEFTYKLETKILIVRKHSFTAQLRINDNKNKRTPDFEEAILFNFVLFLPLISHQVSHIVPFNPGEPPRHAFLPPSNQRVEGETRPSGTSVLHCVMISH